ncbi:alpha-mannosidase [candidate division KSB1 bacterium]|nr:alpha-mannosidase [candidate division KSB1 bacterium]
MPKFMSYTKRQLLSVLNTIRDSIYTEICKLEITALCSKEPLPFMNRETGDRRKLDIGDKWGDLFDCAWFRFSGKIPPSAAGKHVVLLIDVNGELCVFDGEGVPVRGLTNKASAYDLNLGEPGKRVYQISESARGNETIELWADGGCNDLFGNLVGDGRVKQAAIAVCNDELRALYYDFEVLLDFLNAAPEDSVLSQQVLMALNDAAHQLRNTSPEEVKLARQTLAPMLQKRGGDPLLNISAVGHAHIDLAWLWPVRETIRKGARTFSTALDLMNRYPDYIFGASQAQYFLWMKIHYPPLYEKIKQKIREGRIEPQGAMWVEADTNVSGGEALVRQVLQGKRFFKSEFGVEIKYLWLPDVFGYSAALPQILKKSGVDYFTTQKLSWNQINTFPHHSFHWQGIDGTSVLTHMLPEETYNSPAAPRSLLRIEKNYKDKDVSEHCLLLFGIGDGGGGPGAEHLERLMRLKNWAGLPPVKQERACDFFEKWKADADQFPRWVGELYLERHQGTFTTQARNKWYNRKMELSLRESEWTSLVAMQLRQREYPAEQLETIWREVLLYQFHDILPGSSIKRVYDESVARYKAMLADLTDLVAKNDAALATQIYTSDVQRPVLVQNSLSWHRTEWVQTDEHWQHVTVPSMGYAVIDADNATIDFPPVKAASDSLENDCFRVNFDATGAISSIMDKEHQREILSGNQPANRLAVYVDKGNAWDIPMDYADKTPQYMQLISAEAYTDGPRAVMKQTYRLGYSELVQEIVLTAGSRRIDFSTRLSWRETASMLRTSFPVAIHADEATFEIQFGTLRRATHRNTTWELAKDEVPAQKWVDLSQGDYGIALLNDSKYGYKVKGNVLDLNLLRSVPHTGPRLVEDDDVKPGEPHHYYTDQCDHIFTYSLYPHPGDHIEGGVAKAAYELNVPLRVTAMESNSGTLPMSASFIEIDAENIIIEAVKKAEVSDAMILRLYESHHRGTSARIRFRDAVKRIEEVNLMEESLQSLDTEDAHTVSLPFKPFEIKTLRIEIQ